MRAVSLLAGILIVFSLSTLTANACSCAGKTSPCESFGRADAVFVGTVVSAREREQKKKTDSNNEIDWAPVGYKFSVEQSYLGVAGTEIEVFTGRGGGDCGYTFKTGERYLVYAYRYGKELSTGICTRTKPFSSASEDLAFLGTLSSAAPGVTIDGTVMHNDSKNKALSPDILITLESASEKREIRLDAEGNFRVTGLPPGKYKATLHIPETLSTYDTDAEITVADHGCARVRWLIRDNGRVSGRIVNPENQPVANIFVSLWDMDAPLDEREATRNRTNDKGEFKFSGVGPGRYVIAINANRYPDPTNETNSYPQSFYPGVTDQAQAQVLSLGAGEKIDKLEIRIPSKRQASVLKGTVVWADGSPVENAQLSLMDVTLSESGVSYFRPADAQGRFEINGYAGQKLEIQARSNRPEVQGQGPMEGSEKTRIALQRPTETIRIVITKLR